VIYGENGQGKTNLLEALWLFTGCRSFRSADNSEMIMHGKNGAKLGVTFYSNAWEQAAALELTLKKRLLNLNGFAQETPRRMLGVYPAVAFTPGTLAMVQGGPGERRRFLDVALSIITPAYAVRLSKYLKALNQRNALLKQEQPDMEQLGVWDAALAKEAAEINRARTTYMRDLIPRAVAFYAGISDKRETLELQFLPSGTEEGTQAAYLAAFEKVRHSDMRRQMTSLGPHRDDIVFTLDGRTLREYGSQGQQRSAALSLKLAEAAALFEITGERPAALLDDVLSELDARRQQDLLQYLEKWQVFLTCCEPGHAVHGQAGKIFLMENGMVRAA
jgi:DNA replication and repair protein RecF